MKLPAPDGTELRVTAAPARHGPPDCDRGPVIGFVVEDAGGAAVYFSGDTVLYEGVRAVAERFEVAIALLCLGAARIPAAGSRLLTLTAADAVAIARAMPAAQIVPLHFESWEHLTESRDDVEREFSAAGLADRLRFVTSSCRRVSNG